VRRDWLVLALLLFLAIPAWSQDEASEPAKEKPEFKLFGTLAGLYENNQTSDLIGQGDEYDKGKALLSLNLSWWKLSAGAQLEYLYWSDQDLAISGDLDRLRSGFELRKYWLDYTTDHVKGRLGTFFTSFGRGLTLYVQKNEVVGLDEPIHGGNVSAEFGRFEFEALGGQVTDPLLEDTFDREFSDVIWGGRALVNLPYDTYLGASYGDATLDSPYSPDRRTTPSTCGLHPGVATIWQECSTSMPK